MVPMLLFGRWVRSLSRKSQDPIADTSARASETLNAVQTVQAFTQEDMSGATSARTVERAFAIAVQPHPGARHADGGGDLHRLRLPGRPLLLVGAHDVVAASHDRRRCWCSSSSMASWWRAASARLSETWGDLQRAAGASERLMELLHDRARHRGAGPSRWRCRRRPQGAVSFEHVTFRYPSRPDQRR